MAIVRQHSLDRYLSTLFLPLDIRNSIFVLYAFDAEISNIRNLVREPLMGEVRLQWWRDIVDGKRAGEAQSHPLAAHLVQTIERFSLPRPLFANYLEARIFDLYNDPMEDNNMLEGHAGETTSSLFQLAAMIANGGHNPKAGDCAGHAGVVLLIIEMLKNLPIHRARRQCYISAELLLKAELSIDDYFEGDQTPKSTALVYSLVDVAKHHLVKYKSYHGALPGRILPVFLPMSLAPAYFKCFEKEGAQALVRSIDISQWKKQIILWRAAKTGSY